MTEITKEFNWLSSIIRLNLGFNFFQTKHDKKKLKATYSYIIPLLSVLLLVLLFSACKKIDKTEPATAIVSIKLNHSQLSSRMAGVRTSFTVGAALDEI